MRSDDKEAEMATFPLGAVIHATMRPEDLIPAFADMLDTLDKAHGVRTNADLVERARALTDYDGEEAGQMLDEELFSTLDVYSPPMCSFGTHPGDGSDYGFWFDPETFQRMVDEGEVAVGADLDDARAKAAALPEGGAEYLAVVAGADGYRDLHGHFGEYAGIYDLDGRSILEIVPAAEPAQLAQQVQPAP
jgi:hypothetical protein